MTVEVLIMIIKSYCSEFNLTTSLTASTVV